jgi:hypothetical protein
MKQITDLLAVIAAYKGYIDALPKDLVLPAMPGVDRDWADSVEAQAQAAIKAKKCGMCGYVGTATDSAGQCPRCHWDELQSIATQSPAEPSKIDTLVEALTEAKISLEWYQANHPDSVDHSDDVVMERIDAALATAQQAQPEPTGLPFVPWSKEAEMRESWAQPERAPLSDTRIEDVYRHIPDFHQWTFSAAMLKFARAIEAAHGIKQGGAA